MLLLTNDDVERLIDVPDAVALVRNVYLEADRGEAAFRPRATFHVPRGGDRRFSLSTMDGVSRAAGVAAIRIRSDFVTRDAARGRETKYSTRPGEYCGLVLLFGIDNAEPLAILNDGRLQQLRVGATAAAAADAMARPDARVLAVIGSGGQARSHARAYATVRRLESIRVFSPTPERRVAFADEMAAELGIPVEAADSPAEAVAGADLVAACSSSTRPVIDAAWLSPGAHVSSVRHWGEIGPDLVERADRVVIHQRDEAMTYLVDEVDAPSGGADRRDAGRTTPVPRDAPTLFDLLAGRASGRSAAAEITYFLNNFGTGIQFAAAAGLVYRRAVERGLGRRLPTEWFLQDVAD